MSVQHGGAESLADLVALLSSRFPDDRARSLLRAAISIGDGLDDAAATWSVTMAELEDALPPLAGLAARQATSLPTARDDLVNMLSVDLDLLAPLPRESMQQARRTAATRNRLLATGTWTFDDLAAVHGIQRSSARGWVKRHRDGLRLLTVTHQDQTLVPDLLLDPDTAEPRAGSARLLGPLVRAGMSGWSVWQWLETPSGRLGGARPAELLVAGDVTRAATAAERLAANAVPEVVGRDVA